MGPNCEDSLWDPVSYNTTQTYLFLSLLWKEVEKNLAVEAEIWETYDTEIIDGHLLHT